MDHTDNPAYEYAKSTVGTDWSGTGDPADCPDAHVCPHVADAVREVLLAILEASDANPNRIACAIYSALGLSLRDIGAKLHMSQEGVRKHLAKCGRRHAGLAHIFRQRYGAETAAVGSTEALDFERYAAKELAHVGRDSHQPGR